MEEISEMERFIVLVLILLTLAGFCRRDAKAQMPPLYVETWMPSIQKEAPVFPPCHCPPDAEVCVCMGVQ